MRQGAQHDTDTAAEWPCWRCMAGFFSLLGFVCASFTLTASAFLITMAFLHPALRDPALGGGLWMRCALFLALSLLFLGAMLRCFWNAGRAPEEAPAQTAIPHVYWAAAAIVLLFTALLLLPHLQRYPWAAPDEVHHLGVAKNIAMHGRYASGGPETGFRDFDPYDSVGAPVILPIAAAFRAGGVDHGIARIVIAVYFLLLCGVLLILARPVLGHWQALAGVAFVPMAFASIYLGRTVYGEAPAMFWLCAGLACWRKSIDCARPALWSTAAGAAFGCMLLCKFIFVIAAFPFLGVFMQDWLGPRRIRWRHLFYPALGAALVMGAWLLFQRLYGGSALDSGGATVGLYRTLLLFGVRPAWGNIQRTILARPWMHAAIACGVVWGVRSLFRRGRPDPTLLVLSLWAGLIFYWWIFFTPGQLPRYLWPAYAVLAVFTGALAMRLLRSAASRKHAPWKRLGAAGACVLLTLPSLLWTSEQAREVYRNTEMLDDLAIATLVAQAPPTAHIATDFFPLRVSLFYFLERRVTVETDHALLLQESDIIIGIEGQGAGAWTPPEGWTRRNVGRYVVLERTAGTEAL